MSNVNWWLMALAFVLGLVLTFFLLIRRAKYEVPVAASSGAAAGAAVARAAAAGGAAGGEATAKFAAVDDVEQKEPYGAGSIRVKGTAVAPAGGYTVKGNEDSMLYHTTESPSYKQTIAEIWFISVESAEAAGFHRWDSGKSQRGKKR